MDATRTSIKENQPGFFDFASEVGLTKHIVGVEATEELLNLCQVNEQSYVLDVGCGVGVTPCFITNKYGCRVVGVDILPKMVERSRKRAARENLSNKVEIKLADAQDLPFEDNLFDVVITESVTALPEDKQKAVTEYARVTKPNGYVGLNETTWLKVPPPPDIVAWAAQDVGANINPLTPDAWTSLLESAGLKEIMTKTYTINTQGEAKGILHRYGFGETLRILARMMLLYSRSSAYRIFVKEMRGTGIIPENLDEYFGYGLFIGRK